VLPPRAEYVVSSSRFAEVKAYVLRLYQGNWVYRGEENGPRMRRRTEIKDDSE
jgi:hypothetical protein